MDCVTDTDCVKCHLVAYKFTIGPTHTRSFENEDYAPRKWTVKEKRRN